MTTGCEDAAIVQGFLASRRMAGVAPSSIMMSAAEVNQPATPPGSSCRDHCSGPVTAARYVPAATPLNENSPAALTAEHQKTKNKATENSNQHTRTARNTGIVVE